MLQGFTCYIMYCMSFTLCNDKSYEREKSRALRPTVGSQRPSEVLEGLSGTPAK